MPMTINQLAALTGAFQFRSELGNYLNAPVAGNPVAVANARITVYIEFYNSIV